MHILFFPISDYNIITIVTSDSPLPSAPPRNPRTPRVSTSSTARRPSEQRASVQHRSLPVVREVQEQTLVDQLALFSVPNLMLNGLTLPNINVELDTEAHLPNRRKAVQQARAVSRIKYSCACFWCKFSGHNFALSSCILFELFFSFPSLFKYLHLFCSFWVYSALSNDWCTSSNAFNR